MGIVIKDARTKKSKIIQELQKDLLNLKEKIFQYKINDPIEALATFLDDISKFSEDLDYKIETVEKIYGENHEITLGLKTLQSDIKKIGYNKEVINYSTEKIFLFDIFCFFMYPLTSWEYLREMCNESFLISPSFEKHREEEIVMYQAREIIQNSIPPILQTIEFILGAIEKG